MPEPLDLAGILNRARMARNAPYSELTLRVSVPQMCADVERLVDRVRGIETEAEGFEQCEMLAQREVRL